MRTVAAGASPEPAFTTTLLLRGPMGAGKTTFTRALAAGLAVAHPERVTSPTFTLCAVHRGPVALVHVDLFRLAGDVAGVVDPGMGGAAGFAALGDLEDDIAAAGPRILVVEWAEKWPNPPADHLAVDLGYAAGGARRTLRISAEGPTASAVLAAWLGPSAGN